MCDYDYGGNWGRGELGKKGGEGGGSLVVFVRGGGAVGSEAK